MPGKNQHADIFKLFADAAEKVDAVQSRQLGVEHEQVRLHIHAQGIGALAVAAFAHELVVGIHMKDLHQHFPDGGLIFDNDKSFHMRYVLYILPRYGKKHNYKIFACASFAKVSFFDFIQTGAGVFACLVRCPRYLWPALPSRSHRLSEIGRGNGRDQRSKCDPEVRCRCRALGNLRTSSHLKTRNASGYGTRSCSSEPGQAGR